MKLFKKAFWASIVEAFREGAAETRSRPMDNTSVRRGGRREL